MKKFGFTLAEVLVALSIIAVTAALLAPTYVKIKPDKYKFKVLKCFNLISEVNEKLLSSADIYYRTNVPEGDDVTSLINTNGTFKDSTVYGCNGLHCIQKPLQNSGFETNTYTGICKYPNLMADMLHLNNVTYCQNSGTIHTATGINQEQITWLMKYESPSEYRIMIDLDSSSNSPNCVYKKDSPNKCLNPDRFEFSVDMNGDITGFDNLTKVYLKDMTNLDKSADFDAAAQ